MLLEEPTVLPEDHPVLHCHIVCPHKRAVSVLWWAVLLLPGRMG